MNGLSLFVCLAFAQIPAIQVSTLSGEQYQGTLESFSADSVTVKTDTKVVSVPITETLLIRSTLQATAPENDSKIEVRFVDSTRLRIRTLTSTGTIATVVSPWLGEVRIPTTSISSIRFFSLDAKVEPEWNQMLDRSFKRDVVAVRKGDFLDHLPGVIGSLNDTTMQFQMDGEDIGVKREKVFGLIYSKRESTAKKAICQLDITTGERLSLKQIAWNGTKWKAKLVSGLELDIPSELFQTLDYSLGKVTYLSDIEPRLAKHTPFFDFPTSFMVNEYRRDKNFDGTRISLGEKTYSKGLAIHSQTLLKYRLGGEYRRFQAMMGIGDEVPIGDVNVVLKGDNKVLFEGSAKATEAGEKGTLRRAMPQLLDIDVTGIVEFEIFVGFGSDKRDIGDRLYLANARAVK